MKQSREALEAWLGKGSAYAAGRILMAIRAMDTADVSGNEQALLIECALDRVQADERERMAALERVAESARLLLDEMMVEGEASAETQDDLLVELRALDDTAIDAALSGEPS